MLISPLSELVGGVYSTLVMERSRRKESQKSEHKNSFELYLSSIPRLDPVDRTVGWVLMQPDNVRL